MPFRFEARAYGPDATPAEIQAIRDCIYLLEPGIFYWLELPVQSDFQLQIFDQRLDELTQGLSSYRLLIDLVTATPPNAAVRAALRRVFGNQRKLERAAAFSGRNFLLNVAAKFVLTSAGLENFAVYRTKEDALEDLRHAPARR